MNPTNELITSAPTIEEIRAAPDTFRLSYMVEMYLESIGEADNARSESYADTAARLGGDAILEAAEDRWREIAELAGTPGPPAVPGPPELGPPGPPAVPGPLGAPNLQPFVIARAKQWRLENEEDKRSRDEAAIEHWLAFGVEIAELSGRPCASFRPGGWDYERLRDILSRMQKKVAA